jgi:RNA polymerase sigma factor (sigma-70 family)
MSLGYLLVELSKDKTLLSRLEAGDLDNEGDDRGVALDPGPFSKLYWATRDPLKSYFQRWGVHYDDSEDLLQEFMFHLRIVFKNGGYKYDPDVKFSSWFFRVAKNFALNYKRRRVKERIIISFEEVDEWIKRANDSEETLSFLERYVRPDFSLRSALTLLLEEEVLEEIRDREKAEEQHEQDIRRLQFALSLIGPTYRKVLSLHYKEGWGYTKIFESRQLLLKNGLPPKSRTTIINLKRKALQELSMAYAIIVATADMPWATPSSKSY